MSEVEHAQLVKRVEQLEELVRSLIGRIAMHIDDAEKIEFGWALSGVISDDTEFGREWPETKAAMKLMSRTEREEYERSKA